MSLTPGLINTFMKCYQPDSEISRFSHTLDFEPIACNHLFTGEAQSSSGVKTEYVYKLISSKLFSASNIFCPKIRLNPLTFPLLVELFVDVISDDYYSAYFSEYEPYTYDYYSLYRSSFSSYFNISQSEENDILHCIGQNDKAGENKFYS